MHTLDQPHDIAAWLRASVTGTLQCDSRRSRPGDGFVAWPGAATDGRRYVHAALASGAVAALVERDGVEAFGLEDPRVLAVPALKTKAGAIASEFCDHPSAALDVLAITGTNGKTSCAWWTAQLLSVCARPCAVVGTLGMGQPGTPLAPTGLTTPDPVMLQQQLRSFVNEGLKACAIEASSIGLVEGRLNATRVRVAVFTNFTQDHLDFHGSMDAYWDAKAALFDWPGLVAAVVNTDDARGAQLAGQLAGRELDLWTVGIESRARLSAVDVQFTAAGMAFAVVERDAQSQELDRHSLQVPLVGRYNVSNLLCVLASARALGVSLQQAVKACGALTPVPGRMEQAEAATADQPLMLVDYAHTPDALEKALHALQPLAARRGGDLWVVVGCGGDRDAGKRPLMAAVAEREAAHVVLTSDNPRSEDPVHILGQMLVGLTNPGAALVEPDRAAAIAMSAARAQAADVVLIAGKGHEDYQDIQGVKTPFSDLVHARQALAARAAQGAPA